MKPLSTAQKWGLGLAGLLFLSNIPAMFAPTPEGETGPPLPVTIGDGVLGILGLVAVFIAWRYRNGMAMRILAGMLVIAMLSALPAFFVDVSAGIKVGVAVGVLVTILSIALMFSGPRARTATEVAH